MRVVLNAAIAAALLLVGPWSVHAQVRTADATVRGLREDDFPRIVKLT